jgi:DNA polymerase I-like protein with 3'-5' exonuclease and polymerase domains
MIVNTDAKQLEWVTAVYLSQDAVGMKEIINGDDIHGDNQKRFGLPTRIAAKVLLFRTIYGGSGYSFAVDPEFSGLGGESWWDEKITSFYAKYQGLYYWHEGLYQRVVLNHGHLVLPTGREYQFTATRFRGEQNYPRTKVLNYPVQGTAADLMAIARVSLHKRLRALVSPAILWVNTVHDSMVLDIPDEVWYTSSKGIKDTIEGVFVDIPKNFERLFGQAFNLPLRAEITYGPDLKHMTEVV